MVMVMVVRGVQEKRDEGDKDFSRTPKKRVNFGWFVALFED